MNKGMFMNNLTIKRKLLVLLALPILGILILSGVISYDRYTTYTKFRMLNESVLLSTKISALVHEMQKERGMTAGYLGSKGIKFKDELPIQRELTNKKNEEQDEICEMCSA